VVADGPVLVERPGEGVAKLTLNNPPLNLVTLEMTERLIEALEEFLRETRAAFRGCSRYRLRG
jgi:enoyl-CoA hydratase/carnithine racemase